MDIIYPSQPKRKLPCIYNSETVPARNPEAQPNGYYPHLAGFTMRGYVGVVMGHCFNPCVPHFFHFISFELDGWNGFKCYTAGVRYLNANADKYAIDTRYIGRYGQSQRPSTTLQDSRIRIMPIWDGKRFPLSEVFQKGLPNLNRGRVFLQKFFVDGRPREEDSGILSSSLLTMCPQSSLLVIMTAM